MTDFSEIAKAALRNRLLGRWAAGKLGKLAQDAKDYEDALAAMASDNGDVFARVRADFDLAGCSVPDEEITDAITTSTVRAGRALGGTSAGGGDHAAVALKRNLAAHRGS